MLFDVTNLSDREYNRMFRHHYINEVIMANMLSFSFYIVGWLQIFLTEKDKTIWITLFICGFMMKPKYLFVFWIVDGIIKKDWLYTGFVIFMVLPMYTFVFYMSFSQDTEWPLYYRTVFPIILFAIQ